jgi:hypothetical protein
LKHDRKIHEDPFNRDLHAERKPFAISFENNKIDFQEHLRGKKVKIDTDIVRIEEVSTKVVTLINKL